MLRALILAGGVLFLGVQFARADHLDVQVGIGGGGGDHHDHGGGDYHHHDGDGGPHHGYYHHDRAHFAYRHNWHHRRWQHVFLDPQFTVYLGPQPYGGPDYQIVNVYFADGSMLSNVYVYNQDQIELPRAYAGRRIVRLVVTN